MRLNHSGSMSAGSSEPRSTSATCPWEIVEILGQRYWSRVVRIDWEILQEPNHCGEPCPGGWAEEDLIPIPVPPDEPPPETPPGTDTDPEGGEPSTPGGDVGTPQPPGEPTVRLEGPLILEFLGSALRSAPQQVNGSASTEQVAVTSGRFNLGMSLSGSQVAGCGFNQSIRMGLQMLASGRTLGGPLSLNASGGQLSLSLGFDQGTIGVSGPVSLTAVGPTTIRGDVSGGMLDLRLDQGNFSCNNLMNFSFTLTQVP